MCRYNWHSAGSVGCPFPVVKYEYILQVSLNYTEPILSNRTRKLLRSEITKMLIALYNKLIYCVIYYNFRDTFVQYELVITNIV